MKVPLMPIRFLRYAQEPFPGKTAVVCGDRRFTDAQCAEQADRVAGALRSAGVKPDDRAEKDLDPQPRKEAAGMPHPIMEFPLWI